MLAKYAELVRIENVANNDYNTRQEEYEHLQEKRVQTATKKANTEGDIKALETKIASSDDIKASLQASIKQESARYEEMAESIESLEDELDTASDALEFVGDKLAELSDIIDDLISQKEDIEDEFQETDTAYIEYTGTVTNKRNELIRVEAGYEHIKQDIERLKKEQQSINDAFNEAAYKKDSFYQEMDNLKFKMMQNEENLNTAKENTENLKEQKEKEKAKNRELKAEIKSCENNIAFFNKQLEAATSFNDDTAVLKPYIAGLLIDFLLDMEYTKLIDIGDVIVFNDERKDELFEKISTLNSSVKFVNNIYRKAGEEDKGFQIISLKESILDAEREIDRLGADIYETEKIIGYIDNHLEEQINILNDMQAVYNNSRDAFLKKEAEYTGVLQEYEKRQEHTEIKIQYAQKEEKTNSLKRELKSKRSIREEVKNNIEKLEERLHHLLNIDEIKWNEELELLKEKLDNLSKDVLSLETKQKILMQKSKLVMMKSVNMSLI